MIPICSKSKSDARMVKRNGNLHSFDNTPYRFQGPAADHNRYNKGDDRPLVAPLFCKLDTILCHSCQPSIQHSALFQVELNLV